MPRIIAFAFAAYVTVDDLRAPVRWPGCWSLSSRTDGRRGWTFSGLSPPSSQMPEKFQRQPSGNVISLSYHSIAMGGAIMIETSTISRDPWSPPGP